MRDLEYREKYQLDQSISRQDSCTLCLPKSFLNKHLVYSSILASTCLRARAPKHHILNLLASLYLRSTAYTAISGTIPSLDNLPNLQKWYLKGSGGQHAQLVVPSLLIYLHCE